MKKTTLLTVIFLVIAVSAAYAEPRQTQTTLKAAAHLGETLVVEHATAVEEVRTDTIQNNELKRQKIQGAQYRNKEGYAPTEYNTDTAQRQVSGTQAQHQQAQALHNKQMSLGENQPKLSTPEFRTPKFSSKSMNSQMTMSLPKVKAQNFKSNLIAVNSGQTERRVGSTNSAMSNMQIRYMNKVLEGRVDYTVNQGGRR